MDTTTRPRRLTLAPVLDIGVKLRWLRGRADDRSWVRPAVLGLLAATAVLYLWSLDRNGYANEYYAMAVQAGTRSWKAFFFGALDAGSFITVDKPPASLWLMALSGRIFGFNSWSLLAPEALLGVATVGLVYATVRRAFGPLAGLAAGVVTALTPVAVLMFRYDNPDALLTFLLAGSAWALLRSIWTGRTRWLLVSAALVGLAFNTKYLEGYMVLPALVLTYFFFGPGGVGRRIGRLLAAAAVLLVSTGWWMVIVDQIPAADRPYVGGSRDNSVLNLALNYDGLGRIFGQGIGAPGGRDIAGLARDLPAGAGALGGPAGLGRLFDSQTGGEISWLLPLAGLAILVGLWAHRRAPRTDLARASYVLWAVWLLIDFVVFSYASGIFHSYYTVAMAPAVGALVGSALIDLWRLQTYSPWYRVVGAAAFLGTAAWGSVLLARSPNFAPGLGAFEVTLAIIASAVLLAPFARPIGLRGLTPTLTGAALATGLVAVLLGPGAYAVDNVIKRSNGGGVPSSGPVASGLPATGGPLGAGALPGGGAFPTGGGFPPGAFPAGPFPAGGGGTSFDAGLDAGLVSYLVAHQGKATWLVAVSSSMQAAPVQISTGRPVLAMGGFSGGDPAMTVDKLIELVRGGRLRYVYLGGGAGGGGTAVTRWVQQHGRAVLHASSGSGTLYDLSPASR